MKPNLFVIAGGLLISAVAVAQPDPMQPDQPDGTAPEEPEDRADPPPPPPPPAVVYRDPAGTDEGAPPPRRPDAFSIGLGVGYQLPTELNLPNVSSARFRLASGLTFEPLLALVTESTTDDDGTVETDDGETEITLAVSVRYPFRSHGRVDLAAIGTVAFGSITSNPEGSDNDQTTSVFALGYGLGLDYWINRHWNLSFNVGNPLVVRASSSRETGPGSPELSVTRTSLGLIFDPRVQMMLHLHL